ncbi:IS5 family transposase [Nonomuraea angiospora]|uniref:IS5 family transposase n=1 Tax=Nonomuraea angiospora TaxID=46172 RepID=A0ABR9LP18_9ACTN|nr:IS5 family transposase [Nonomuraea angiospora]
MRARIDWKYALGLELTDTGFDYSVLSEFRDRLIAESLEQSLLDTILERAVTAGLLRAGGRQRTDSTHVLMAMRTMNRLEQVHETVRAALNALAAAAPDWLLAQAEPGWFERYEARVEDYRLPKNKAERILLGHEIGVDGNGVSSACAFPCVTARPVPAGTCAPAEPKGDASPCARRRSTKPCHARQRQSTDEWQQRYAHRAGVEGTIAQGVKGFGLRRSRYRETAKTHLQHLLIAAAMNLTRLDAWLTGTRLAPTRTSHFAALRPAA